MKRRGPIVRPSGGHSRACGGDRQYEDAKMSVMSQSETSRTTKTTEHPDGSMYRFLECTADQYMTRGVITVARQVTLRDLERLFEKHDFNSFPVVEEGKMLGTPNSIF
jgi:CBS domain-containing protein